METIQNNVRENIKTVLEGLNIHVVDEQYSACSMPFSRTNKFVKVQATDDKTYLIRINGDLWPPFTRASESDNLEKLGRKKIKTNVITNSNDFQICHFVPEEKRFSLLTDETMKMETLAKIVESIKHYQCVVEFENALSIREMVADSFNRLPDDKKIKLNQYYELIMKIIFVIEQDGTRKVSSHNDLLPTSIYYIDGEIIVVDWEYSALNHPFYDLAHLSILSSLTLAQDQAFLAHYDESMKHFSIGHGHSFVLMKAVISFVLLVWKCKTEREEELTTQFLTYLQDAFGYALHENSMLSELASLISLENTIPNLLEPFHFRRSTISSATGSCLLESVQTIMNNGYYEPVEVLALRNKLCQTIKAAHPQDNYTIEGKSLEEYCDALASPGHWPIALKFLSEIFSVKFYIYKRVNDHIEAQPLEFGDSLPYLHSCAYLIFNEVKQQYEPLLLFNSNDNSKIVKTKFLVNSWLNKLLEKFIYDENSCAYQICNESSELYEEKKDFSVATKAIAPDQSVFDLISYINQLRDFRQTRHLMESNTDLSFENKSDTELNDIFRNELNVLLSTIDNLKDEISKFNEVKSSAVPAKEQDEGEGKEHFNLPATVSEALLKRSDSSGSSVQSASPIPSKFDSNPLCADISETDSRLEEN